MLPLVWTLWALSIWTCGAEEKLFQDNIKVLYPELGSHESIECDCFNASCALVYWFRTTLHDSKVEYIGRFNNAERRVYGSVDINRFTFSRRGSSSYVLRILRVTEADTGIYSCVLKDNSNNEMWKPGAFLRPGVLPPTVPPTRKIPAVKPGCRCPKKTQPQESCAFLVLWSLVGLLSGLALALICTLYYFSRLPKKCQHHFVKKRPMT